MGKLEDTFWYFGGVGWTLSAPLYGLVEIGDPRSGSIYNIAAVATVLIICLCLCYRPEEPKRVALFGLLTIVGTTVLGILTGTEGIRALVPTLAKWVVAMLFAAVVVRFRLDHKIRAMAT
jgi:hypothetical protein